MKVRQAVVMVGGKGTRLLPLTETRPKIILPVADKPCLWYLLRSLAYGGIEEVILACGYKSELMRRTIGDDAFTAALKAYVSEYYLENARPDCLIACFEKASGKELKSYFDSWTSGKVKLFAD